MKYLFNEEGVLQPQRLLKCELAYFYGKTPRHFRRELHNIMPIKSGRYYSASEVKKIMEKFDVIYQSDVEIALPRIEKYLKNEKKRNKMRFLRSKH